MGIFDGIKRELTVLSRPYEEVEPAAADAGEEEETPISLEEERSKREAESKAAPEPVEEYVPFSAPEPKQPERVVPMAGGGQPKLAVIKPTQFNDASAIVEQLRQKRTIVLNMEGADGQTAKRLLDVLSGAAFALEAKMRKVARNTFIIAPYNVDVLNINPDQLKDAPIINLNIPQ